MHGPRAGFSLVELMVAVAVIGILAAIALPNFVRMQLEAKRAELPANVTAIKAVELVYDASFDGFRELPLRPRDDSALDKDLAAWDLADPDWSAIGWAPDGPVRGNYQVGLSSVDHPELDFLITARSDVDDDEALSEYTASERHNATLTTTRTTFY